MKICISSYGSTLDSRVSKSLVCHYFFFIDPETMETETVPNPYPASTADAGRKCANLIIEKGIRTIMTTFLGTETRHILDSAGVEIVAVEGVSVREAVEAFQRHRSARQSD